MKNFILYVSLLLGVENLYGQCLTASFTVPDTVCSGSPLPLVNTSTGTGLSYKWDFCPRELAGSTNYAYYRFNNYTVVSMIDFDLIKVNASYYVFINDTVNRTFVRGDIGTDINNRSIPAGTYNSFVPFDAYDFIVADSILYGLATYSPTNESYLITFPNGVEDTPVATLLPTITALNNPSEIKLVHIDGSYYAMISNRGSNSIIGLSFGNSMTNTPVVLYNTVVPGMNVLSGIDVVTTCNPPVGFVCSATDGNVVKLSFTNGINNAPTFTAYTVTGSTGHRAVSIAQEFNNYYVYLTDSASSTLKWLQFGNNDFNATPSTQTSATFYYKCNHVDFVMDSSRVKLLVSDLVTLCFVEQIFYDSCAAGYYSEELNPTFSYYSTGWNKLSLKVTDSLGFTSVAYDSVYVINGPTAKFSFSNNLCFNINDSIAFTDLSTSPTGSVTGWNWDFGDGTFSTQQNPYHTFNSAGTFQVRLTINAGCQKDTVIAVTIKEIPAVNFAYNLSCANSETPFNDLTTAVGVNILSWTWNFNDGSPLDITQNPSHVFTTGGLYNVSLTATTTEACSSTTTLPVNVKATPVTAFNATRTCFGDTVSFQNITTINDGTAISYLWDLGSGGATAISQDTIYYYPAAVSYNVSLIAYSTQGCSDTLIQSIVISTPPAVSFSFPATNCQRNSIPFTDQTTGSNLSTWAWNFGDGDSSQAQNPTHVYSGYGTFLVHLSVSSGNDCVSSFAQNIVITPSPAAAFSTANVCNGSINYFSDLSTVLSGSSIIGWVWAFGDGDSSLLQNPQHTYANPGTYQAILNVTSDIGCSDSISQVVTIYENPVAGFIYQSLLCAASEIYFLDTSSITNGIITNWLWTFSDNGSSTLQDPYHIFTNSGPAFATLTVTTVEGCSNTITNNFTVLQPPQFTVANTGNCLGKPTLFNYQPLNGTNAFAWTWSFGDNTYSFIPNPSHQYTTYGSFPISLVVVDNAGCNASFFDTLTIFAKPVAAFISNGICQNENVQFVNQTISGNAQLAGWLWAFGDGQFSTTSAPQHIYSSTGNFNVSLIALAAGGCNDTAISVLNIKPSPLTSFNVVPETGAPGNTIQLINTTSGASQYAWDFGDGSPIIFSQNATHIYADTGSYQISLTATSIFGCSAQLSKTIDVLRPVIDLFLKSISYTITDEWLQLYALLSNAGNTGVNTYDLQLDIQGKSNIIETGNLPIPFANEKTYAFNARFKVNPKGLPDYACIKILTVNGAQDTNPDNNEKCISLNNNVTSTSINPNPVESLLSLSYNLPNSSRITIKIISANGQYIQDLYEGAENSGFNRKEFNISGLSKGVYFLNIATEDQVQHLKFLKL